MQQHHLLLVFRWRMRLFLTVNLSKAGALGVYILVQFKQVSLLEHIYFRERSESISGVGPEDFSNFYKHIL